MINECKFFNKGICILISGIIGNKYTANDCICSECLNDKYCPGGFNETIKKESLRSVKGKNLQRAKSIIDNMGCNNKIDNKDYNKERLEKIKNGNGVGSNVWRMLESIGVEHRDNCPCLDWAERLNTWGPDICNKNRKEIIDHFKKSAKNFGWGDIARAVKKSITTGLALKLSVIDPFGSLLDEAIRLSEKQNLIDIIIPLCKGSRHNDLEIKIALRSIEKNAIGYRKIFIIGYIPPFLKQGDVLNLIELNEFKGGKESRISDKVRWALNNLGTTDRIAFWNDDYVLLQETDIRNIPNYHKGGLFRRKNTGYKKRLNATYNYLKSKSLPTLHYDCHVPIIYDKEKFLSINNQWLDSRKKKGFVAKSIYGNNFCNDNKIRIHDMKLGAKWQKDIFNIVKSKRWIVSYGDAALNNGFGDWLLDLFPEKSSFEI